MCGIAGILSQSPLEPQLLQRMIGALSHRGPDDEGLWVDPEAGVALGHRRLAIIDLSPAGHQPMISGDGRYVLTFNGEIYNHAELRGAMERADQVPEGGWHGCSDTEVLLQAIALWGLEEALKRSVGMFALGLWDRHERTLQLARDRFGEKPLYYGRVGRDLVFASELKALRAHPHFDNGINPAALGPLMARGFIPAPLTIYQGVYKLPPASVLTIGAGWPTAGLDVAPVEGGGGPLQIGHYWSYADAVLAGLADPISDEDEALQALEGVLADAIREQSVADVPVGAFLSGGVDSSTVVALYQKYSTQSVRTYSIGFEEAGYDEAVHARQVAARLGTVHHEQYVTAAESRDVIPMLPAIYDEPFADSSQIPTYLVSRFARRDVTVALTGDGGDELFGGYTRHAMLPALLRSARRFPGPLRAMVGKAAGAIPDGWWQKAGALLPGSGSPQRGAKIARALRTAAAARDVDGAYARFVDDWAFEQAPVAGSVGAPTPGLLGPAVPDSMRVMYADAVSYLPDDILCKVDRASMAVSLETRVPFLDHRVAELAARIPAAMKIQGKTGKAILRKLLYREAPRDLFERPKAGFAVPVGQWLRGPLRPWAEELLEPTAMQSEGWLDPVIVQARWRDHLSGRRDSTSALWTILMFQVWLRENG